MDGALIDAINDDVVTDQAVIDGTLAALPDLAEPSGGYRRVPGDTSYAKHEFLFIEISLARAYLEMGRPRDASKLVDRIVKRSNANHNQIPEMYVSVKDSEFPGKVGDPTGAIPMVGYGAGVYTIYMLERASR